MASVTRDSQSDSIDGHFPGLFLRVWMLGGELSIIRDSAGYSEPRMSFAPGDIVSVRTSPAGHLVDGREASSIWLDLRDGRPPVQLVQRGATKQVADFADQIAVLTRTRVVDCRPPIAAVLELRPPMPQPPADAPADAQADAPAPPGCHVSFEAESGRTEIRIETLQPKGRNQLVAGGTFSVDRHSMHFHPGEVGGERTRAWPRFHLFDVQARCSTLNGQSGHTVSRVESLRWELSVRSIDGKRDAVLRGQDEELLRWLARQLSIALAVPAPAERVRKALASLAAESSLRSASTAAAPANIATASSSSPPLLDYAQSPPRSIIYHATPDRFHLGVPRSGWKAINIGSIVWVTLCLTAAGLLLLRWVLPSRPEPPRILAAFFAAVALVFGLGHLVQAVNACLQWVAIDVDAESLRLRTKGPFSDRSGRWACDQIVDVRGGKSPWGSFAVLLELKTGESVTLIVLPRPNHADSCAKHLRAALGLPPLEV